MSRNISGPVSPARSKAIACGGAPIRRTLAELRTFSGRTVDVPACFIAGKADWGSYQNPGVLEAMQTTVCTHWRGTHFVDGAGHWAQQEQPDAVSKLLIEFLGASR